MVATTTRDISDARAAAHCVVETHRRLAEWLRVGLTLAQIDSFCAEVFRELKCESAFKGYKVRGHPPFKSHTCLSVNDMVVHGEHDSVAEPLREGDLLALDIGVRHRGFIGDAAWTYSIGSATEMGLRLQRCGRESLRRGIAAIRAGRPLIDWAKAVQDHVERECGFHLVRGLGGHGIGRSLHEAPYISNTAPSYPGEWNEAWTLFQSGMLLAVEPMIALGTNEVRSEGSAWPIWTADRSLSVHYEADVMVTEAGCENFTQGMDALPDVVGCRT
jgi:methionyl aminopeptidase